MGLTLAKALRLNNFPPPRVAFVGAGGKTTALFQLAREIAHCVITTTTHLGAWQADGADLHIVIQKAEDFKELEEITFSGVLLITGPEENDRLKSLSPESLKWLEKFCITHSLPLLIEADGARQKALKAPEEHEPVIPDFVDTVVVMAGLSGLGKPLSDEWVYEAERFKRISESATQEIVTEEIITKVLAHEDGGLKNIPAKARRIVLLNQADTPELQASGSRMAQNLRSEFDAVVTGTLQPINLTTHESVAAIILAAGESSRYGEPKQLLDYHGRPFIRVVAETALRAELSPVIVVAGANHELIEAALKGLPIQFVYNPNWKEGQSSSIKEGIHLLEERIGAAIFLLADQPQIKQTIIRALVEEHHRTLNAVIAPMVEGRRANPVLLDRVTFPALLQLEGDVGGRGIFSKFSPSYIQWDDSSLLLDVDRPEDYKKLLEL